MTAGDGKTRCANCGEAAGPGFCPHCGQEVEARRGPVVEVVRELLSEWLSLDSRLVRSLRALAWPGRLSEEYLGGRRAPFLRPFRLYLVASVVLFSTLLTLEPPDATGLTLYLGGEVVGEQTTGEVRRSVQFLREDSLMLLAVERFDPEWLDRARQLPRQQILDAIFGGMRRLLPLTLIFFVPFLALGLKLLYVRGRTAHSLYIDHLVFALHFQSALFFALTAAWLAARLAGLELLGSGLLYAVTGIGMLLAYLPLALRRFYAQTRLWTAVKTFALLFVYARLLDVAVSLSVLAGIWRL